MKNPVIKIVAVNISDKKGVGKKPVDHIDLIETGIIGDAHAGLWHRQVSLLGLESIERFEKQAGRKIQPGEFAENITTSGIELVQCKPLDKFVSDNLELEVTQIGKECHGHTCSIFREVGNCVMPKEGIFTRVIKAGSLQPGDKLNYVRKQFRVKLITLSDRASRGEYEDLSGKRISELLHNFFTNENRSFEIDYKLMPDSAEQLRIEIIKASEQQFDYIFTCGGTGIGPKDITVDVVKSCIDKDIPGIMDMIRLKYGADKPNALISRSVAGIISNSIIFTLPGSQKAVQEYMTEIVKTMMHIKYMLHSIDAH
ncbi:MAG: hypothetical protein KBB11_08880 [Bacteroidales bacterium]|nr:hypothetical protein [Bacteroidales bacterium]HQP04230.1 molybdopterin-binding protein [Bacteroidales bacterium]